MRREPAQSATDTELPAAMTAILQDRYGPPGTLLLGTINRSEPSDGEVLIAVSATGVSHCHDLRPHAYATFPLARVTTALDLLASGEVAGKIALNLSNESESTS